MPVWLFLSVHWHVTVWHFLVCFFLSVALFSLWTLAGARVAVSQCTLACDSVALLSVLFSQCGTTFFIWHFLVCYFLSVRWHVTVWHLKSPNALVYAWRGGRYLRYPLNTPQSPGNCVRHFRRTISKQVPSTIISKQVPSTFISKQVPSTIISKQVPSTMSKQIPSTMS